MIRRKERNGVFRTVALKMKFNRKNIFQKKSLDVPINSLNCFKTVIYVFKKKYGISETDA